MGDVAREQAAERPRILPRAAAAHRVREEFHAVHVRENARAFRARGEFYVVEGHAVLECSGELLHERRVGRRGAVAEPFGERLAHHIHVAVFAKDHRQNDPEVRGSAASIRAAVAVERSTAPA